MEESIITEKLINAGLYIRVSTEKQVKEGYSVSAQKENLSKFAKQQGFKIFDIYADEGKSGKNIKDRPAVKRLINDIQKKEIDVVVLYKFDRLTRDSKDTENIIELIQQYGIQVFTLAGGTVDVSTATGRFSVRINGAVAQLEREQTIERIKVALEEKVKQGYTLACATTCYGYNRKIHEKEQTINQAEAKIVKRIFKMYIEGKSFTEICNILNAEKIPTKNAGRVVKQRKTGKKYTINSIWVPKTIRLILTNPTYIGKVRYHIGKEDELITDGKHKPIISKKTWYQVQEKIHKIKKSHRTNLPKEDVYYCGTLVCGLCGKKLTSSRTNKNKKDGTKMVFNSYRCINREKKLCICLGMSHSKVEKAFMNYINNIEALTEIDKVEIKENDAEIEELKTLKKFLGQTSAKKKEVMDLFMINKITDKQLKYMTDELNKKSQRLKEEIDRLEKVILPKQNKDNVKIPKTIKEHWKYLSNKEKFDFLTNFIEEIVVVNKDRDKVKGKVEIINIKFYEE